MAMSSPNKNQNDVTEHKWTEQDHFFSVSPNILCVANPSGYITRINPAVEEVLGYTQNEITERPFIDFVHPEDVESTLAELHRITEGSHTQDFQNRYRCSDGSYKWLSWTASAIEGVFYCAAHDITALKETESALRESERWMRTLTESVPQLVFVCEPDGWNTYFNQRWVDYTGLSLEESHGHGWTQVFHPDDQDPGTHAKGERGGYVTEARLRGADGTFRWFLIRGLPLPNATGAVEKWLGTCTDIEELKRAEQGLDESRVELERRVLERTAELLAANEKLQVELAERTRTQETLRNTQEMLQIVMNHIPQAIFWKDLSSTYLGCNVRLARDAGLDSPADVIGKTCFDMPWAEHAEGYRADDRQVMQSDTPKLNIEERLTTGEGDVLWLRTNKIPLHGRDGQVVGVLGSYEDITEQRQAVEALQEAKAEAERANQAKSEFLSRMSHELRTPLNAILGFGQLLEMSDIAGKDKEGLNHILRGGRHLLGLINEVLDIARVESGHADLSLEPVCLAQAVLESYAMLQPLANQAGVKLRSDIDSLHAMHVVADVQRLKQVLINLLSNGIKYNVPGGSLSVQCIADDETVRISVRDTGRGMSPENLKKLFTPFQRLDAANLNIEGSGLGLVLSQQLVAAMKGRLEVESVHGKGSTFTICLPKAIAPVHEAELPSGASGLGKPNASSDQAFTVLCVEDNVSNLHLVSCIFETLPEVNLITTMQGSVGLDLARQHVPDLVLLDLDLPDISGREVLSRLRAIEETKHITIIIVSADATESQIEKLMAAGADGYLTKPLDVSLFLGTVHDALRKTTCLRKAS